MFRPFFAGITVFFVSAFFHEVLVGVPLHMVRYWAFSGIILQASAGACGRLPLLLPPPSLPLLLPGTSPGANLGPPACCRR